MANKAAQLVFIPAPGLGHIISTIELAKLFVNRDQRLSITILVIKPPSSSSGSVVTKRAINRVSFIELPQDEAPPMHDLKSLLTSFNEYGKSHCKYVRKVVTKLMSQRGLGRLAGFVMDMFCTYLIDVANEFNVPTLVFFTSNAAFLGFKLFMQTLNNDLDRDVVELSNSDTEVVVPSFAKPVPTKVFSGKPLDDEVISWLDKKPPSSVVLLCFGSMGSFDAVQVKEIARALEQSSYQFVWSLRRPPSDQTTKVPDDDEDLKAVLPEGFLDRIDGVGKIIWWAPQVALLAHSAVGGFVSHYGWNSLLESLWFGVPVATWPVYAEQQMNAFEMVELSLAVEIKLDYIKDLINLNADTVIVTAEEIESGIQRVMTDKEVRRKVKAMSEKSKTAVAEGGSSYAAVGNLIQALRSNIS